MGGVGGPSSGGPRPPHPGARGPHQLRQRLQGVQVAGAGRGTGQAGRQGVSNSVRLLGGWGTAAPWDHVCPWGPGHLQPWKQSPGHEAAICLQPHEPCDQGLLPTFWDPLPSLSSRTQGHSHHQAQAWGAQEAVPGNPPPPGENPALQRPRHREGGRLPRNPQDSRGPGSQQSPIQAQPHAHGRAWPHSRRRPPVPRPDAATLVTGHMPWSLT